MSLCLLHLNENMCVFLCGWYTTSHLPFKRHVCIRILCISILSYHYSPKHFSPKFFFNFYVRVKDGGNCDFDPSEWSGHFVCVCLCITMFERLWMICILWYLWLLCGFESTEWNGERACQYERSPQMPFFISVHFGGSIMLHIVIFCAAAAAATFIYIYYNSPDFHVHTNYVYEYCGCGIKCTKNILKMLQCLQCR